MKATHEISAASKLGLRTVAILFLLFAAGISGCGRRLAQERFERPEDVRNFDELFAHNCSGCHGAAGRLGPAPPLNDPLFLAIIPEAELTRVVSQGRTATLMPPFAREQGGPLTAEQIAILVRGIRSKWSNAEAAGPGPLPDYLASSSATATTSLENKEIALQVFGSSCSTCHGSHGQGGKEAGALRDPALLSLLSEQALRRIVITGRPDLGMPDFRRLGAMLPAGQPLTNQQISDVVALVSSWRHPHEPAAPLHKSSGGQ